ncbi:hypothetical protein [Caudoviricetes sp.]|nr:hypothetical protein [Caudoviricetes sp.]UOF82733.1 hypothetical protein [Caudoviricetes sp.]
MTTAQLTITELVDGQASGYATANEAIGILDGHTHLAVKDRDLTAPPGSPVNGDRYLIAASPTGAWAGQANSVAIYFNGNWKFQTPKEGWACWVDDEDLELIYTGTAWIAIPRIPVQSGITASITQSSGNGPLTRGFSHVATVANANDAVTLPTAVLGQYVFVVNRGANTLQIFPASGDKIDGGVATTGSITLVTGKGIIFLAIDATDWFTVKGA